MKAFALLVATAALAIALPAAAQEKSNASDPSAAQEPYRPSLSEIMTLQQLRHIKLWFAGHAANWPLADYEIGELNDGFGDVNDLLGGDIVKQHVGSPLATLQKAVDDKDSAAFSKAFDALSAGCNGCHHALDHAFIVIQRPTLLPYSNQAFSPSK